MSHEGKGYVAPLARRRMEGRVLTLCGSARFEELYILWNRKLTLSGHTVFSLGAFPSQSGGKDWYTAAQKERLDQVHKVKIMRSEAIVVLSEEGYVGDSTRSEIEFAILLGKKLYAREHVTLNGIFASRFCSFEPALLLVDEP
jgi:hypothetical protein